jgi:urease accessory protein
MLRVTTILPANDDFGTPFDTVVLEHDERRVRRKLLRSGKGTEITLDLAQTVTLEPGQGLQLDDGRILEVVAADELLYEIRARDAGHLLRLAWHIGNRHTPAQLDPDRILIKRDHVLKTMLEGLGARVSNISEPFFAEHGAYHSHNHGNESHALLAQR